MKIKNLFLGALGAFSLLASCKNDSCISLEDHSAKNDSLIFSMKFMESDQLESIISASRSGVDIENPIGQGESLRGDIYWGKRAPDYSETNRNCLKQKAHICYVLWYSLPKNAAKTDSTGDSGVTSILEKDQFGNYYATLLLKEEASFCDTETPYISVDEDEFFFGIGDLSSVEFTIVQGKYFFNKNIGPHGGFRINIEVNKH
ncbi:MAG: hypothetical protein Q4B93_05480 [Clostridia bacterium]|nr:hypothetical protein [Clostridia bacterium]